MKSPISVALANKWERGRSHPWHPGWPSNPNLGMVERIASALGVLREREVFLGGCATGLLITDPAAPALRTTRDVDVVR